MRLISKRQRESGREVNAIALLFYLDAMKKRGISPQDALTETDLKYSQVKKPGAKISWSDYSTVLQTMSLRYHFSREDFIKLGAEALHHPIFYTLISITSHIMSLPELYCTMQKETLDGPGPQLVSCVTTEVDQGIDNSMVITLKTIDGYNMVPEFLYTTLGTFQEMPALYGLDPIEVHLDEYSDCGIYSFHCPNAQKRFSKLKSFIRNLFKGDEIAQQLRMAYAELNKKSFEQEEQIRSLKETKLNLEMANRTKSDFVARISHELRTPLNGILGMGQLLEDQRVNDETRELIDQINVSSHHLLEVINTILDFSRLSSNNWEIRTEPFSPEQVCKELQNHFENRFHTPQVRFEVDTYPIANAMYRGDSTAFHQIVYNVLDNAFKFTHEGTISLHTTATASEISVIISDTGVGIPQEQQSKIFDSFTQVEEYKTRSHEGTGIGLTVTQKLVELLNGTISVDSTVNVGTWIEITLPMELMLEEEFAEPNSSSLIELPSANILLAEDNRVNQIVIEKYCAQTPLNITVVENGLEALNAVSTEQYDLILMDIMMPIMSGDEAADAIRQIPHMKNVPIVALTANAMEGDREKFLSLGMNGYLPKPVSREALFSEICTQLSH